MTSDNETGANSAGKLATYYDSQVSNSYLDYDATQKSLAIAFDYLLDQLTHKRLANKKSSLGWLFGQKQQLEQRKNGLYIWGAVGRGKTMLMDIFFDMAPVTRKKRVHFNEFMRDVHERIHQHRLKLRAGETTQEDPIPPVAADLAKTAQLLCFDEFTVTDIADAMILSRLFTALFENAVTIVSTSNVEPENLYLNGINRQNFLPFIDILKNHTKIFNLDAKIDYRRQKTGIEGAYFTPLNAINSEKIDAAWADLTKSVSISPSQIKQKGRIIEIPDTRGGFARFDFSNLCEQPLAASDYLAIISKFHTLFLYNVPIIEPDKRNIAKRFILLIDTLYDNHRRLIVSADGHPHEIYTNSSGVENFEFERTISRLIEMRSEEYLIRFLDIQNSKL